MTTMIDLSRLPPPEIIEVLDFEEILAGAKRMLIALFPEVADELALESAMTTKILQVFSIREMMMRGRVNDGARGVLLAAATGTTLDHIAARWNVQRFVLVEADPDADPPTEEVRESDAALRHRTLLALDGFSTAGSREAYLYHALSAHRDVLDASVEQPVPGTVRVALLSRAGNGTAAPDLIAAVHAALNGERVRPVSDTVSVVPAEIVPFTVEAGLVVAAGPDPETVRGMAAEAVAAYAAEVHRMGRSVRVSAIFAALHQPGVERVILTAPAADIELTVGQAPWCDAIVVEIEP